MELDGKSRAYLKLLVERTDGDSNRQVSMYDIGTEIDLDRDASQQIAEMLMAEAFVEIRSLSGAIGITRLGLDAVDELTRDAPLSRETLCTTAIMDETGIKLVEKTTSEIKSRCGNIGLKFDTITEMIADLKSIDAQLFSPKPKTVIVREALSAIRKILESAGERKCSAKIGELLGANGG